MKTANRPAFISQLNQFSEIAKFACEFPDWELQRCTKALNDGLEVAHRKTASCRGNILAMSAVTSQYMSYCEKISAITQDNGQRCMTLLKAVYEYELAPSAALLDALQYQMEYIRRSLPVYA